MFQPGDKLRFGFKAANEVGLVGELGENDLDRDLAPDGGLVGAVHDAEPPTADSLAQFVAFEQCTAVHRR